jgi:SAM-dependent methyltransferase
VTDQPSPPSEFAPVVSDDVFPGTTAITRRPADADETRRAQRRFWDWYSPAYQRDHASDLGEVSFVWSPERCLEDEIGLLGDVRGLDLLEVGCGGGQCSRWVAQRGGRAVALDLSESQLRAATRMARSSGISVPLVLADATALPFADASYDVAFAAHGAVGFVADSQTVMREVARVLRPGGRWVFAVAHSFRWCFPDDPGENGLTVSTSYFDRTPYVETADGGEATYVEHHRTMGDRVAEIVAAGLRLTALVEPEWPAGHRSSYENWSELRGRMLPGTSIWVTQKPA